MFVIYGEGITCKSGVSYSTNLDVIEYALVDELLSFKSKDFAVEESDRSVFKSLQIKNFNGDAKSPVYHFSKPAVIPKDYANDLFFIFGGE